MSLKKEGPLDFLDQQTEVLTSPENGAKTGGKKDLKNISRAIPLSLKINPKNQTHDATGMKFIIMR